MLNDNCKNEKTLPVTGRAVQNQENFNDTFPVGGDYEAVKAWYDRWFDSDEGELIKPAFSGSGYSFSDVRRTTFDDGSSRTRYTVTNPDGSIHRVVGMGRECHSGAGGAEFGDNCGCDKCEAFIKQEGLS